MITITNRLPGYRKIWILGFIFLFNGMLNTHAQQADIAIQKILQEKRKENLEKKITGYKIQIYYGLSESKARGLKNKFAEEFPGYEVRLFYAQPEWKVHVGNFRTKYEAEKALKDIRAVFPNAFVLQSEINPHP